VGDIHIHYSRRGSRREGMSPFVRQIAPPDEPSQLIDRFRKRIEFHTLFTHFSAPFFRNVDEIHLENRKLPKLCETSRAMCLKK
jgi:hypothetical protein